MVSSRFTSLLRLDCEIESIVTTGRQKKIDSFSADGVCNHCNTVCEAMGCYYHYCHCQEARLLPSDADIERGVKKRNKTRCVKIAYDRKDFESLRCGSVSGGVSIKMMHQSRDISEKTFPINAFERRRILARNYQWETLWLRSM